METIKQNVEQLQEAAAQLRRQTDTSARLALVLADNLVELLLYGIATRELSFLHTLRKGLPPNKERKIRNDYRTMANFVAKKQSAFSDEDKLIANVAHELRNEAYHRGVVRSSIIRPVALAQFGVACRLLPAGTIGLSYSSVSEVTDFFSAFGATDSGIREKMERVSAVVKGELQLDATDLASALSEDLASRCNDILEGVEYLPAPEWEKDKTVDARLRRLHATVIDAAESEPDEDISAYFRRIENLANNDSRIVSTNRLNNWKQRSSRFSSKSPGHMLSEFWEIDEKLSPLEEAVRVAVMSYDNWIDMQVDEHRLGEL